MTIAEDDDRNIPSQRIIQRVEARRGEILKDVSLVLRNVVNLQLKFEVVC